MADLQLVWNGASGREYSFYIHPVGTAYVEAAGVYLFCTHQSGIYRAVYVGQTDNLNQRLNAGLQQHHAWPRGRAAGVTHFGTMLVPGGEHVRLSVETDLRHHINPVLSGQ